VLLYSDCYGVVFDTGQFVQKFIFGICGTKNVKTGWELTAATFDSNAKNLLGCATIRDWEWETYAGGMGRIYGRERPRIPGSGKPD